MKKTSDLGYVLNKWKEGFETENKTDIQQWGDTYFDQQKAYVEHQERLMSELLYNSNITLNGRILYDEVFKHVIKAKQNKTKQNNKAVGFDNIPNEVLKNKNIIRTLHEMFNLIFDTNTTKYVVKGSK